MGAHCLAVSEEIDCLGGWAGQTPEAILLRHDCGWRKQHTQMIGLLVPSGGSLFKSLILIDLGTVLGLWGL